MFVVFESDKRVHCSLLHCVCAHVRVYGWLHSLHSTVIDMSVRHCPANEMTSLIDRALTRLSTGPNMVNMRLTSHMPNLSQQSLNLHYQISWGRKTKMLHTFKTSILQVKIGFNILLSVFVPVVTKKSELQNKNVLLEIIKKSKYILNAFWMNCLVSQSQSCTVLHHLSKNLLSAAMKNVKKSLKCFQTTPHNQLHWAPTLSKALVLTQF